MFQIRTTRTNDLVTTGRGGGASSSVEEPTLSMILQSGSERLGIKSSSSDSGRTWGIAGCTIGSGDLETDDGRKLYRLWVINGTKYGSCGHGCLRWRLRSANAAVRALAFSSTLLLLILAWRWKYLADIIWLRSTLSATFFSSLLNLRGMMEENEQKSPAE